MNTAEAITEITGLVQDEKAGRVISTDGDNIRIRFNSIFDASHWISNYAEHQPGHFDGSPLAMNQPVIVRLSIAAYIRNAQA